MRSANTWPFTPDSPWNTPMADGATYEDMGSPATALLHAGTTTINSANGYGIEVFTATAADPVAVVTSTRSGRTYQTRISTDATATSGTDSTLNSLSGRWQVEAWHATKTGPVTWMADFATRVDLLGDGCRAGTRAARFPSIAGLIRPHHVDALHIPHALAVGLPASALACGFIWPASAEDGDSATSYTGLIPMGSRLAIPAAVDLEALTLSPEGVMLAYALRDYGAIVAERAGQVALFADAAVQRQQRTAYGRMLTDWQTTIRPLLRIAINASEAQPGGPGTPLAPNAGPVTADTTPTGWQVQRLADLLSLAPAAVIASDNFRRWDGVHRDTDSGHHWTGPMRIIGEALARDPASLTGYGEAVCLDTGRTDGQIAATITALHDTGTLSLIGRATGKTDCYRLTISPDGGAYLSKSVGGVVASISPATPAGTVQAGSRVTLALRGPRVTAACDGQVIAATTDTDLVAGHEWGFVLPSTVAVRIHQVTVSQPVI